MAKFTGHPITDDSALGGSVIERSLRFNSEDNTELTRTPSGAGSRTTWTLSFWAKISDDDLGSHGFLFSTGANSSNKVQINLESSNRLTFEAKSGGSTQAYIRPSSNLRDISAWYHFVIRVDTTDGTSSNRVKIYINGTQQTDLANSDYPSQNTEFEWNKAQEHNIGKRTYSNSYFNGYLTEINFIDGYAYDSTYFGYTDFQTGLWRPKRYEGTYGTNGFHLDVSDNSSTSALGKDTSGNGNDWSVNNITTGADLVTNGEFSSDSDWTKDSSWTISGGKASNSGGGEIYQTFAVVSGITYIMKATVDATGDSALGNTSIGFRDTSDTQFYAYQATFANGSFTDLTANAVNEVVIPWTSTVTGNVRARCYSSDTITIDNWSVIELADSVEDTPTNNFPVMNPLQRGEDNPTVANGNLYFGGPTDHAILATFPIPSSGKWYWEYTKTADTNLMSGIIGDPESMNFSQLGTYVGGQSGGYSVYAQNGQTYAAGSNATYMATPPTRTTIMIAYDADTRRLYFGADGHWGDGSGNTDETFANAAVAHTVAAGKTYYPAGGFNSGSAFANFGQQRFSFTPPTGYKALSSRNLPPNVPSIIRPQKHFDTIIYTGDGTATRSISGLEFKPDLVWIKNRSQTDWHIWGDSVRGFPKTIYSNRSEAEVNGAGSGENGHIASAHDHGFVVKDDDGSVGGNCNANSENYVAWCWKGGGTAASNSDGSITSSVSANTEAGFSVVTWTGSGADASIGHGLGKKPQAIFVKNRSASDNWRVWWKDITTSDAHALVLNDTTGVYTGSDKWYNSPNGNDTTTTTFGVSDDGSTNRSGELLVAYCWTSIPGYSKIGTYKGNGSSDGVYVHLGFSPAFIMVKRTDSSNMWLMMDNKRYSYNVHGVGLKPNDNSAEFGWNPSKDFLSNGFKIRTSDSAENTNGGTYIYMAFAEQPGTTSFDTFPNAR